MADLARICEFAFRRARICSSSASNPLAIRAIWPAGQYLRRINDAAMALLDGLADQAVASRVDIQRQAKIGRYHLTGSGPRLDRTMNPRETVPLVES